MFEIRDQFDLNVKSKIAFEFSFILSNFLLYYIIKLGLNQFQCFS